MAPADGANTSDLLERVLVLVRGARDAELTTKLLSRSGVVAMTATSIADLCAKIDEGAAAAILEEEMLDREALRALETALRAQPPWSDFPVLVFAANGAAAGTPQSDALARALGNVTFLDRPVRARTMLAAVQSALRSRRRQYEGRHAIESRDVFLAMLGHELRNPLGAIRLALAVLDGRLAPHEKSKEHNVIERQSTHLARLVDDLLDVARVTRGKVVLQRTRTDLVAIAQSAFEALEGRAAAQGLAYGLECSVQEAWVDADRQRLEQVFTNLIANAIKFTPRHGRVRVTVGCERDTAVVTVTDTGVGIAPEMLPRVFDAFSQAERTLDRSQGGIGLGLALVRSLVQLHGGAVHAASGGPGKGSSFTVELPLVERAAESAERLATTPETECEPMRVVVVEDSADIRELVTELLRQEGHVVEVAKDGPAGLEAILTTEPDIAFVDLGLPGFDGLELARRAREAGSPVRLVAVTGYGQPEDRRRAEAAGFDEHLTKPVARAELRRALAASRPGEQNVT